MDTVTLKEGMKAFVQAVAGECADDWIEYLTEDELKEFQKSLSAFATEEMEFMETGWKSDNPDRMENQIRELIDDMIKDAQLKAGDNAESYEDLFDRVKITVCDGPEGNRRDYTLMGEIEEKRSPDNDKAAVEFTIVTNDMDFQVSYPWGELNDPEVEDENAQDGPFSGAENGEPVAAKEEGESDTIVVQPLPDSPGPCPPSAPPSLQSDDETVTDHGQDDSDAGSSSPVSRQEGWEHGLGDVVLESIERDESLADDDTILEYTSSEGDDDASLAGPSNYQEMGENMDRHHDDFGGHDDDDGDDNGGGSPVALQPVDMEEDDDSDYFGGDPKGKKPQKAKRTSYSLQNHYQSNDLYDVVFDVDKPNGPPTEYRCKIPSCNNWQGKYHSRHAHFKCKHPEEWFALTGKQAKVHKCSVDGCGWSSRHGSGASYLRRHMKEKHGSGAKQNKE